MNDQVLHPPTLSELVELAVAHADKGYTVPEWHTTAKWAACLITGGSAALSFIRWLDFEQGIVLANLGPGVCDRCALTGPPDGEEDKHLHPPFALPLEGPDNQVEILLAMMHGIDLEAVERERAELVAWWRGLHTGQG
jgi:hypothetical protein